MLRSRKEPNGEGGIRTLGTAELYNGFRVRPIQPLSHLSGRECGRILSYSGVKINTRYSEMGTKSIVRVTASVLSTIQRPRRHVRGTTIVVAGVPLSSESSTGTIARRRSISGEPTTTPDRSAMLRAISSNAGSSSVAISGAIDRSASRSDCTNASKNDSTASTTPFRASSLFGTPHDQRKSNKNAATAVYVFLRDRGVREPTRSVVADNRAADDRGRGSVDV